MSVSTGKSHSVLIVVENLPVPFDRRVWAEATTLNAAGYEVSIISPALKGYDTPYENIDGIHVYRHPLYQAGTGTFEYLKEYAGALFWQFRLAFKVWRARRIDILHACNPPDLIFLIALFFKAFGVKFIFDHHDLCPELYEAKYEKRGFFWRLLFLTERLTFASADVSIATNESYRRIAIDRGKMDPRDVFVVRSGPRLEKLERRAPRPELKKGADFLIGYVGVIGEQEGLELLVEAAARLQERYAPATTHFAVVGSGPALQGVKDLVREKGLDDVFTFTGRASDDLFLDVLNTADVCVNSDRWSAMNNLSTMNKIMEYMALGKPIVQFDLHEGRESAGAASLYARADDPDDFARKIAHLLEHPDARAEMGALGRRRIEERLSWKHSEPALLAAYSRAIGKRETARATPRQVPAKARAANSSARASR